MGKFQKIVENPTNGHQQCFEKKLCGPDNRLFEKNRHLRYIFLHVSFIFLSNFVTSNCPQT